MNRIKELTIELNKASSLYYNGKESFLTDKEFDNKLKELKELEKKYNFAFSNSPTLKVGADPILNGINVIKIEDKPMLSLDKVHTTNEIISFSNGRDIIASIKCDGLSVRIVYKNGKLFSANTRGNGTEGSDITEHIKQFLNVPLSINKKEDFIIDGEAIIYDKDFQIINKDNQFKNNRNTASGSLALLDMSIVKNRRLSFIGWDTIKGGNNSYYHYRLEEIEELGFDVVPALALDCTKVEENEINDIHNILLQKAKEKGIPCDGIVWRINDILVGEERGRTTHHFLNAVAWKPHDEEYETELIDIEWSMSRNGTLTPVAVFNPIEIDDTTVEKANLHNISIMRDILGLYPERNQKIWVIKANMIIPQISKAIKNDIPHDHILENGIIRFCPICGAATKIITSDSGTETLICTSNTCNGKLINKLDHFCGKKGLDIKGLSKATLEKLIDWQWVNSFNDIFTLKGYKELWIKKEGFGEKSVNNILKSIEDSSNNCELWKIISSIGIPFVGPTIAKKIANYFTTWENFRKAINGKMDSSKLEDFGEVISNYILNFDYKEIDYIINNFISIQMIENKEKNNTLKDKVFCLTGKSSIGSREKVKELIEAAGGKVTNSVTSKTDYLLANKVENTAKYNNAKKFKTHIINDKELLQLLE